MGELRKDPITGRWVIMASERSRRPHAPLAAIPATGAQPQPASVPPPAGCPFCPGNERLTPPEVAAVRPPGTQPDSPGWQVRVVPNKFPALVPSGSFKPRREGPFERRDALGAHEVIVETPNHDARLQSYSRTHLATVLRVCFERYERWSADSRLKSVVVFRNYGRQAGASLDHPHSQLAGLPFVGPVTGEELRAAARFRARTGRCLFCEVLAAELDAGRRVVCSTDDWVAFEPFASRVPFETWLVPRQHAASPTAMLKDLRASEMLAGLAGILGGLAEALASLGDPAYNYVLHAAADESYHWHIEIFPKLSVAAGFEIGMGVYIDTALPEDTAAVLSSRMPASAAAVARVEEEEKATGP